MSFRDLLQNLQLNEQVSVIRKPISKTYEIAGVLKQMEPEPVLFTSIEETNFSVAGNLFCSKKDFAQFLNIDTNEIIPTLIRAIENPKPCEIVEEAPCQENIIHKPDLDDIPILKHCELDGGNYISSGIVIAKHPEYGQNVDFHRFMQFSKTQMAVRVVKTRHFDQFLQSQNSMEIAVCIGNPPHVLAAAATSVDIGVDEMEIANAIQPVRKTKAVTSDLMVPADCEFVLEGTIYLDQTHDEGPFVDLTETYDIIRQEPVFEIKCITHRNDACWHALLPGALEHKLLMGMPREPTIYKSVNAVVNCLDVNINPGGCSWLHAIVQIKKENEEDGKKAIEAAFAGHKSCKHVFVVDEDIDIYDPLQVEWAMATRFQGNKDMIVKEPERGSSLDPSASKENSMTTKIGFDLTKPLNSPGKPFEKAEFPKIDLSRFFEGI